MFSCDTLDAQELLGLMAGYFHSPETCQLNRWGFVDFQLWNLSLFLRR